MAAAIEEALAAAEAVTSEVTVAATEAADVTIEAVTVAATEGLDLTTEEMTEAAVTVAAEETVAEGDNVWVHSLRQD